ncbi:MAG: M56 family metallopeptidase [Chitinophagales bacterium]
MNYLQNMFDESLVNAIGWTILHSIWQGAVVVVIVALLLSIFKNPSSKLKYNVYTSALFAVLACSLATFFYLHQNNETTVDWVIPIEIQNENNDIVELVFLENIASETREAETSVSAFFGDLSLMANDYMSLIVVLWLIGCLLFSIRFAGGFAYIQRLRKRDVFPVEAHWQKKMDIICTKIGLKKSIRLLESAAVQSPMVIGHFKPLILFPIGALTGLNPSQVEAILAHELAHIYRNDYLVNILQSFVEIVLFYHPAAWWLSNKMQATREHCCDDLAIDMCGDRMVYAKALTQIESLRLQQIPHLAAAFAGNGKEDNLMARIQRLFSPNEKQFNFVDGWVASMMLVIALLAFSWTSHSSIEAAEKEVSIFIDSMVEDLKLVAEDMGGAFVELTADSTKRAEKQLKRVEKERAKLEKKIIKEVEKRNAKVQKMVLKSKDGYVIAPLAPPAPPVPSLQDLPLVLPPMPKLPIHLPELPAPPEAPILPDFIANGFYDLTSLITGLPDVHVMIAEQPDFTAMIAEQPDIQTIISSDSPSFFYMDDEGDSPRRIIIGKDKDKDALILKQKLKSKHKSKYKIKPPTKILKLKIPVGLDSIKRQELQAKLKPLKEEIAARQQELKESMKNLQDMDEDEIERIIEKYEAALENYEDELEEWQDEMEDEHEHHFEWNEDNLSAFEDKMEDWAEKWEEWGEKWGEKIEKDWDEEKIEAWAEKWEEWGEQWGEKWGKEWGQAYEQKMKEWEQKCEKQAREYEFHFKNYEGEIDAYEQELDRFEDAYEEAHEEASRMREGDDRDTEISLKEMTSELREMLEDDGLVSKNTRQVKVKYNHRNMKVNGSGVPKDMQDKYIRFFGDHLGHGASFNLTFSDRNSNISLSGKNMEIHHY